ncbi:transposase IS204/IS1001/IS1096/IS1165 family domain protein [Bordetella holmesii 70147]|nr:transposase IS204/IS1001/IS1096/IS1165 family domain protein [Bordetella holmesii 70147]
MPLRLILDFSRIKAGIMLDRKTIERLVGGKVIGWSGSCGLKVRAGRSRFT